MVDGNGKRIQELSLNEIMGDRFGRYSKYIIQERAIPDVRDGLKPVQRRILYAMFKEGNTYEKGYRKSAKTVGNVIGNYHPHGDTSVYDAMVRMSQDWKIREPLVDMQGNNGSMDGDPPAAMRYTEARLSKIANVLVEDINKNTVDWVLNFDDTEYEPTVLPAGIPNVLVNGATGISAGYATDIPPHNLGEVIDAAVYLLKHPNAGLDKLMQFVKAPDFPTGGIIQGKDGVRQAYETGKGKIVVRSKTHIETLKGGRQQIVITEVPYEVNKTNIVLKIDDIRFNKDIDGISEVRDESDRDGLRIVIELKKDAITDGVLTYLFKNTAMQVNYNFNMVAIHDKRPEQMGLKAMLDAYLDHRKVVVTRRTQYELDKAEKRQHIVEGLIKAISILDDVINAIRSSKNKTDAKENISKQFGFSEEQAEAIVSLQLYRLSNTDITELQKEAKELEKNIKVYKNIINNPSERDKVISDELKEMKKLYATDRLTALEAEVEKLEVEKEVLISEEDTYVSVSKKGYIKRTSVRSYQASQTDEVGLKDGDTIIFAKRMNTLEQVVLFTNKGNVINRPVHFISDIRWKDTGEHISQTIHLDRDEHIISVFGGDQLTDDYTVVFTTKEGQIKRTLLSQFEPKRNYKSNSYVAMKLKTETDEVVKVELATTDQALDVFLVTHNGLGLRYSLDEVSEQGPNAAGVKAINLKDDDYVVSAIVFDPYEKVNHAMFITQRGAVKKMNLNDIDSGKRAQRGLQILRKLKSAPHLIQLLIKVSSEDAPITIYTDENKTIEIIPSEYVAVDRTHNGSFVFDENSHGKAIDYTKDVLLQLEIEENAESTEE